MKVRTRLTIGLHAAGYIKKPVSLEGFREVIHDLEEYWFVICKRVREASIKA